MKADNTPILWSFRRCPYAMRARMAIHASGVSVELREILLRDKPPAFLATSEKGTVPVLVTANRVIDESLDIMMWALTQRDPHGWLRMPEDGHDLIDESDGPFKAALDRTKYAVRYPDDDPEIAREQALNFLRLLEGRLSANDGAGLFGSAPTLADIAILPFVRQFAHIDRPWFDAQGLPFVVAWLDRFLASAAFAAIMSKYPPWQTGQAPVLFPQ